MTAPSDLDYWPENFRPPLGGGDHGVLSAALSGDTFALRAAVQTGGQVNVADPVTGLSALHIAVGQNDLALCTVLIEELGAAFFADRFGRWPSLIAIECKVDDALQEYIAAKEEAFIKANPAP